LAFLFMLPAQALANRVNATIAPHHDTNRHFTTWNLVGIVVGAILMILITIAAFLPAPGQQ
jgi:hypothetical protein